MEEPIFKDMGFDLKEESPNVDSDNSSPLADANVSDKEHNAEVEPVLSHYAYFILSWRDLAACVAAVVLFVMGISASVHKHSLIFLLLYVLLAALAYFVVRLLAKLFWASVMLFVKISTTLERIDSKLENNEACQENTDISQLH